MKLFNKCTNVHTRFLIKNNKFLWLIILSYGSNFGSSYTLTEIKIILTDHIHRNVHTYVPYKPHICTYIVSHRFSSTNNSTSTSNVGNFFFFFANNTKTQRGSFACRTSVCMYFLYNRMEMTFEKWSRTLFPSKSKQSNGWTGGRGGAGGQQSNIICREKPKSSHRWFPRRFALPCM